MSNQDDNIQIVKEIYDAVGAGDVDAILERVTDDANWAAEAAGSAAPWYGPRAGKAGVASFFNDINSSIEILEFTPRNFAAGENDVHLLVDWTFRPIATGREASDEGQPASAHGVGASQSGRRSRLTLRRCLISSSWVGRPQYQ